MSLSKEAKLMRKFWETGKRTMEWVELPCNRLMVDWGAENDSACTNSSGV